MPIIRMPDFAPLTIVIFLLFFFCLSFFFSIWSKLLWVCRLSTQQDRHDVFFPQRTTNTNTTLLRVVYSIYKFSWIIESANKHLLFDYYLLASFVYYIILSNCIHWLVVIELNESKFEKAFLCGSNGSMLFN